MIQVRETIIVGLGQREVYLEENVNHPSCFLGWCMNEVRTHMGPMSQPTRVYGLYLGYAHIGTIWVPYSQQSRVYELWSI